MREQKLSIKIDKYLTRSTCNVRQCKIVLHGDKGKCKISEKIL